MGLGRVRRVANVLGLNVDRGTSKVDRTPTQIKQLAQAQPTKGSHHEHHGVLQIRIRG
jgi:hypothetical protein